MDGQTAASLGAVGGALVEAINLHGRLVDWQAARSAVQKSGEKPLPALSSFVDLAADTLVAFTRLGLGALAGWIFHAQIIGPVAAIAVGVSAPALLVQIGASRPVREAVQSVSTDGSLSDGLVATHASRRVERTPADGRSTEPTETMEDHRDGDPKEVAS